jgi:hypothetical protein
MARLIDTLVQHHRAEGTTGFECRERTTPTNEWVQHLKPPPQLT